jgi:hypothetical protein
MNQRGYMKSENKNTHTHTPTTHKIERKGGHSKNPRRQLTDDKTHHDPSTTITRKNP